MDDCPKCRGTWQTQPVIYAVVLGVPDEAKLLEIEARLELANILHVTVREPDAPYNGSATAIGLLLVQDRRKVRRILGRLKPLGCGARSDRRVRAAVSTNTGADPDDANPNIDEER